MKHRNLFAGLTAIIISFSAVDANAQTYAITDYSVNYMRLKADYESPLETQELMGVPVEVLESYNYWKKIRTPQPYDAWCTDMGLAFITADELEQYKASPKYIITEPYGQIYSKPSLRSEIISDFVAGDVVRKSKKIKKGFAEIIMPSGEIGYIKKKYVQDLHKWSDTRITDFEHIKATALSFKGIPYLWGGMSIKGFDCSGLVRYTYMLNGTMLPRNASQQCYCGEQITIDNKAPMAERIANLEPGDLVFFGKSATLLTKEKITHVAIYLGDGKIIHSSHEVRINSLLPGQPDTYNNAERLIRACRIIGHYPHNTTANIYY